MANNYNLYNLTYGIVVSNWNSQSRGISTILMINHPIALWVKHQTTSCVAFLNHQLQYIHANFSNFIRGIHKNSLWSSTSSFSLKKKIVLITISLDQILPSGWKTGKLHWFSMANHQNRCFDCNSPGNLALTIEALLC